MKLLARSPFTVLLIFLLSMLAVTEVARSTSLENPYTTQRITDPALAPGPAGGDLYLTGVAGPNQAHVTWVEETPGGSYGAFYRQLPFGATQQIPGVTLANEFSWFERDYYLAPDGTLNLVIELFQGAEGSDLFLWRPGWTAAVHLSDPALSEGDVLFWPDNVFFDSSGLAHIAWVEEDTGLFEQNLYYWDEATGTTTVISDPAVTGSNVSYPVGAMINDVVHLAWIDVLGQPSAYYYWDSGSGVTRQIPGAQSPYPLPLMLVDGAGLPHIFWAQGQPFCPYHWTPGVTAAENLATDPDMCIDSDVEEFYGAVDGSGEAHFFWAGRAVGAGLSGPRSIYVWRSGSGAVTASDIGFRSSTQSLRARLAPDGTMYALWSDDGSGIFTYWNSGDDAVGVLEASGPEPTMEVDSASNLHLHWSKPGAMFTSEVPTLFYFDTVISTTVVVNDPAVVAGPHGQVWSTLDETDVTHLVWIDTAVSDGQANAYHWNSVDQTVTLLIPGADTLEDLRFALAADGTIYAAWQTAVSGEGTDMFLWSLAAGAVDVSPPALTAGDVTNPGWKQYFVLDGDGNPYIAWFEDTSGGEQDDAFAAFILPNLANKVYLPTSITR